MISFPDLSDVGNSYKKFASVFNAFLNFLLDSKPGVIEINAIAVVFILLYVLSIALLVVLFNVKNSGHCKKLFAIILQILFYAFTLPLGYLLGISLNGILESDGTSVASFFFALIMVIIVIYINNITTSTINYLSNPSQSIFTTFTGRHTMLFLTFNLFVAALGQVGQMFPSWYPVFAVIVSFALHAYLLFDIFSVQFATISGNVIAGAAYIFVILGNIVPALVAMKLAIPGAVYVIILFACFIIAAITIYFVFKKHINRTVEIVTLLENQNPLEVYDEMDLNSEKDGLYYERLGLFGGSILQKDTTRSTR